MGCASLDQALARPWVELLADTSAWAGMQSALADPDSLEPLLYLWPSVQKPSSTTRHRVYELEVEHNARQTILEAEFV